ncbi:MAG: SUMF1/EgtB/PvdO family nonheme iron enzyme [Roseiarcus sp.]|jgi:formylglycine-generating enzyme required for sulfatase activity
MTAPVFVSHSSRDLKPVRALVDALEAHGIACWISERDIAAGDNYGDSIVDAIEKASAMVLVFSGAANDSDEIKKEVALASQRRITLVPVRIEDATPSKAFRYELATRNWIDVFPDWDAGVAKLSERLAAILALPPSERATPAPTPTPAPPRSNAAAYGLGAVVALAVVAGGVWFATRPAPVPTPVPTIATPTLSPTASPSPTATATGAANGTTSASTTIVATIVASPTATASPSPGPTQTESPVPSLAPTPVVTAGVAPPAAKPAAVVPVGPPPALAAGDPGGEVFKECDECPEMVVVPAGKAMLGSPSGEPGRRPDEMTPHQVEIAAPLAVGRYAVTFKEWDACFAEGGCGHRSLGDLDFGRDRRPVLFATWNEAQLYVDWLKRKTGQPYRLLSEAEWEYAARGCTSLKCPYAPFWFGAITPEIAVYNWRDSYQGSPKSSAPLKTAPVDSGPPNPFGLYNILGNVRQWTLDCWSAAPASAASNGAPVVSGDCSARATRGGSWADKPVELRAAARSWETVDEGSEKIGFRVARPLAP